MTSLAPPEGSIRSVEPFDFLNPTHRALYVDLAIANERHFLNEIDNNIALILHEFHRRADAGEVHAFITVVGGEAAGIFWVEIDRYGIGRIRGGLFPSLQTAWNGAYFLRWMVRFCFESLELRRLECELALYNKQDRESATAERLYKRVGFKKLCIRRQAFMEGGKPRSTILLEYLRDDYNGFIRK